MRIIVEHRTRYRFTEPQTRLIQLLRMTPDDTDDQTIVAWSIDVDCDARLRESRDGLGNRQTMLYAEGPLDGIDISVRGEVLTGDPRGLLRGSSEPLPPEFYLRDTDRTHPSDSLADFVRGELGDATPDMDTLIRLGRRFGERFERTDGETLRDAAEVFDSGNASVREIAQALVAGLRAVEVPARYVGGYRQNDSQSCAPHGWVEAFLPDQGWCTFDPSRGVPVDDRYVRVAIGIDTASAAPVAGSRLGPGEESLDVALIVARAGSQG
ncbi:transglutaminase N-terminal domain-containing protein [Sphingomonas sp. IW22]|uniref:transglutaminase family protein n=1 Tax=Sphingomonas sp. IW22 TaxID=3242489 RepID=UPI0035221804